MASDGAIYAGQEEIGAEMGWCERTARRHLKSLEDTGFLVAMQRGQRNTNCYRFNFSAATLAPYFDRTSLSGQDPKGLESYAQYHVPAWTELSGQTGQDCPTRPDSCCPVHIESESQSESYPRVSKKRENPFEEIRQRFALIGAPDSLFESIQQSALTIWNDMRQRIGADPLHVLQESHRKRLLPFVLEHGLGAWSAVVAEIERDPWLNGEAFDPPNPMLLGKALLRAVAFLERAIDEGRYVESPAPPITDDEAILS